MVALRMDFRPGNSSRPTASGKHRTDHVPVTDFVCPAASGHCGRTHLPAGGVHAGGEHSVDGVSLLRSNSDAIIYFRFLAWFRRYKGAAADKDGMLVSAP
jgi:hypothetical protein